MKFNFETKSRFKILSKGRVALCISAITSNLLLAAPIVNELPTNPNVVSGNININTNVNTMNVNQSTDKGIINWGTFNIGSVNTVNFNQPNVTSTTLNRVVGNDVSTIAGNLNANGKVVLINPNGVVFEEGSKVDVGAITATTMNQSDENFLKNNVQFTRDTNVGKIINKGNITAKDKGYVALLAPEIINEGIITAKLGTIALSAGDKITLDFKGDGVLKVEVEKSTIDTLIENRQLVQAEGGIVYISSKSASDIQNTTISNKGTISANSMQEVGGKIVLLGSNISNSGNIEAKGKTGGGEILIGGDYQGSNADIYHQATDVTQTSTGKIDASATDKGSGGKVVLWSEKTTNFAGSIKATGAGIGGNGGKVEVSGKTLLNYQGNVNLLGGQNGKTGDLLLDPYNIYITAGTGGSLTTSGNDSILGVDTLISQLNTANVTISTGSSGTQTGIIGVLADITTSSTNDLTLTAASNIMLGGNVNIGGKFTVNAGGNFVMGTNLSTAEGMSIIANGGFTKTGTGTSYLTGNITTNNTAIDMAGPIQIANFNGGATPNTLTTNGGNINITGAISNYSGTAQTYAAIIASNLYNATSGVVEGSTTDIYLSYNVGNSIFLNQAGLTSLQYLIVGAGGGGGLGASGQYTGGGGGGGGVTSGSYTPDGSPINITVGAGGLGANSNMATANGGDSSFGTIYVGGGGAGGFYRDGAGNWSGLSALMGYGNNNVSVAGRTYVAGGGGGGAGANTGIYAIGGTGTSSNGGTGATNATSGGGYTNHGGGGGGATGNPIWNASSSGAIVGGAGATSSITGTSIIYGVGGNTTSSSSTLGSGGGSSGYDATPNGANGTVIVRYAVGNAGATATSGLKLNSGTGAVTLGSSVSNLSNLNITADGASFIAGIVTGSGSLTKAGTGTLTLPVANTYTGGTIINAGVVKAGINSAFGAGLITVNSGGAVDLNGKTITNNFNISGTGASNSGAIYNSTSTAETLSGNITLEGDSTIKSIEGGALTLSGTINGAYALTIDTNGLTDGAFIQSGIVGETTPLSSYTVISDTANVTLSNAVNTTGAISISGGNIILNNSLTTTGVNAGISLLAKGNITSSSVLSLTSGSSSVIGGNILLASDIDNSGDGYIYFSNALSVNSYGGDITFGGGNDLGSSYAVSTVTDGYSGVELLGVFTLNSSGNSTDTGGTITLKGKTGGTLGTYSGVRTGGTFLINSGTEKVIIDGTSTVGDGVTFSWNAGATNPNYAITSAYTGGTAISVTGTTTATGRAGIMLSTGNAGNMLFQSTGANGGISLIANSTTYRALIASNYGGAIYTNLQLLSQGGNIIASGTSSADYDIVFYGSSHFGDRMNATAVNGVTPSVTGSNANISILSDLTFYDRITTFSSMGNYTFAPTSNAFTSAATWNGTFSGNDFVVAGGAFMASYNNTTTFKNFANITGLTIGKASSTSNADITISSAISIAGGINLYGGNININNNLTTTATSSGILVNASGNITSTSAILLTTGSGSVIGGNILLASNIDDDTDNESTNNGYIRFSEGLTINSNGGNITLGGGNSSGTGYSTGSSNTANTEGIRIDKFVNINSSGGNIAMRGKSYATTVSSGVGAFGLGFMNLNATSSINSGTGTVYLNGYSQTLGAGYGAGLFMHTSGTTPLSFSIESSNTTANAIQISGKATGTTGNNQYGIETTTYTTLNILAPNNGGITLSSSVNTTNFNDVLFQGELNILANSGAINLLGGQNSGLSAGLRFIGSTYGVYLGSKAGTSITSSSSDITIKYDKFDFSGRRPFVATTGKVVLAPMDISSSFGQNISSSWFTWNQNGQTMSGLTIGKLGNTTEINMDSTLQTVAGAINIYGGNIYINNSLTSTGSNTVTLLSSGNITDGASGYIVADKLAILGGNVTLDHTSNAVNTLAVSGVSGLSYINSTSLALGTVGITNGINATGIINIATLAGDVTISQNIATTNTTASAITINSGKSTNVGTATGGSIIVLGSPAITAGSGGTIKLYSGSVSGSTGLTTLVGSGSGNFRYNSDETTTNYSTVLATNAINAIYREGFSILGTISSETITYGDVNPNFTISGVSALQNGDSSNALTITGSSYSTANKLKVGTYTVTANGLAALGYTVDSITTGTLIVNTKALDISGLSANNKIYDGVNNAIFTGVGTVSQYINDIVSLTGTASGIFSSKDVGTNKNVTVSGLSLTGADASNYSLNTLTLNANIAKRALTLTADNRTKIYGDSLTLGTSAFTSSGLQNGETVGSVALNSINSYANNTAQDVATYSNEIGISNVTGGTFDINNYDITYVSGNLNITKKALTIGYTGTNKTYDGTNSVIINKTLSGLINSDTVSVSETSMFDNVDVGVGKAISISNITLSGADAGNYSIGTTSTTTADITKANLTVKANNDGKFVTQSDTSGYNSVSYTGFVNGETNSVLSGTLTVARNNSSTNIAGTYTGVLEASGYSSNNYNIVYISGDYTIVGSNQLLVKVANVNNTYGTATQYAITSIEYYDGSNIIRLDNGSVVNSSVSLSNNQVSVNDGASGTATFSLSPNNELTSTAGKLKVGNYQLGISGAVTENSVNFSDTITVIGSHEVNQKSISASASGGISKVYDGTTSMNGVNVTLSGKESLDNVTVNGQGAFSDKNVGNANKSYTISNLALSGDDSANYYISGGSSFTGNDGTITAKQLTLNASKTYDGNTDLTGFVTINGLVNGETLTYSGATINDKNVATSNKYINAISLADGSNGGLTSNYALATLNATNASATITAKQVSLNASKVYDGTTNLNASQVSISGLIGGETLTYSGATINDKNVTTTNKYINAITLADATDSSGGIASNYTLPTLDATNASASVSVKDVTVSASGISKVYDGTTAMNGVSIGVWGKVLNDDLTVNGTGTFLSKNAGTNLSYTLNNLVLNGNDASNYQLTGGNTSVTGNDGVITQKTLIVNYTGANKVYDGNNIATVTTTDNKISGDDITINKNALFSDKNVGTSKTILISNASLSGTDASNYNLDTTGTTTANISRLNSVTWIGGNNGNWFDPANWAGGAVPDLSNVANVIIPNGVTVSFDTIGAISPANTSSPVNIDSLGTSGNLTQNNGTLQIGNGGMNLNTYTQTGGVLNNSGSTTLSNLIQSGGEFTSNGNLDTTTLTQIGGTIATNGNLNVADGFLQGSNGSISVGGNTTINDSSNGVVIGNLNTTGTTSITSIGGDITQANGTSFIANGSTTLDSGINNIVLNNPTNDFKSTVNIIGNNVTLKDINSLDTKINAQGNVTIASGANLNIEGNSNNLTTSSEGSTTFGTTTINGDLKTTSNGDIVQMPNSKISVNGISTISSLTGDIILNNPNNDFKNTVNANGKNISLTDINSIELGNTTVTQKLNINAIQDIIQKYNTVITSGGDVTLLSSNGNINLSENNDFQGSVNSNGNNITLKDTANGIKLADTKAKENLTVNSKNGDITQKQNSVIEVNGQTYLNATNENNKYNIILDGSSNNQFKDTLNADGKDVTLKIKDRLIRGNIKVAGKEEIIINGQKVSYQEITTPKLPLMLPEISAPKQVSIEGISLPKGSSNLSTNATLSNNSSVASGNTSNTLGETKVNVSPNNQVQESSKTSLDGMIVGKTLSGNDVKAMVIQGSINSSTPTTLIVSIKSSEGFEFEIPQNVISKVYENENLALKVKNVMKSNGETLPSWVTFDSNTMSFNAKNVPQGSLPLKVNITLSNGKVDKNIEIIIK